MCQYRGIDSLRENGAEPLINRLKSRLFPVQKNVEISINFGKKISKFACANFVKGESHKLLALGDSVCYYIHVSIEIHREFLLFLHKMR